MPTISIIIPIFNVADYLQKTIESAVNQSYHDVEIILVDDGSTDGSSDICDEYARKYDNVRVIHKENEGLSSARNAGAEIASGDYVMFLDGDDYLRLDAVERLVSVLAEYPSDLIQFEYAEVDADGKLLELAKPAEESEEGIICASTPQEFFAQLYRKGGTYASGCTKLFRKELIQKFPFQHIRHEDEMWCTEAFQQEMTVTYIPDTLYYYVMRDNSIIHSRFSRSKLDSFRIIESRICVLNQLALFDLLPLEYGRLFDTILSLYCSAKDAGDQESLDIIRKTFIRHKKYIKSSNGLKGKYKFLFECMCVYYNSINLYYWFVKI